MRSLIVLIGIALSLVGYSYIGAQTWTNPVANPPTNNSVVIHRAQSATSTQWGYGALGFDRLVAYQSVNSDLYCDRNGENCASPTNNVGLPACSVGQVLIATDDGGWACGSNFQQCRRIHARMFSGGGSLMKESTLILDESVNVTHISLHGIYNGGFASYDRTVMTSRNADDWYSWGIFIDKTDAQVDSVRSGSQAYISVTGKESETLIKENAPNDVTMQIDYLIGSCNPT